jgi:hypothetical protein
MLIISPCLTTIMCIILYIWHYMNICTIIRLTLRKLASISITKLYTYLLVSLCVFTPGWFFCRCNGPGWKLPMDPRNWGLMGCLLGNTRDTLGFMVILWYLTNKQLRLFDGIIAGISPTIGPLGLSQKGQPYGGPRRSSRAPLLDSFVQVLDCHWTLEWGILVALAAAAAAVSAMVL